MAHVKNIFFCVLGIYCTQCKSTVQKKPQASQASVEIGPEVSFSLFADPEPLFLTESYNIMEDEAIGELIDSDFIDAEKEIDDEDVYKAISDKILANISTYSKVDEYFQKNPPTSMVAFAKDLEINPDVGTDQWIFQSELEVLTRSSSSESERASEDTLDLIQIKNLNDVNAVLRDFAEHRSAVSVLGADLLTLQSRLKKNQTLNESLLALQHYLGEGENFMNSLRRVRTWGLIKLKKINPEELLDIRKKIESIQVQNKELEDEILRQQKLLVKPLRKFHNLTVQKRVKEIRKKMDTETVIVGRGSASESGLLLNQIQNLSDTDLRKKLTKLGEGGFGVVYKLTLDDGRVVALKASKTKDPDSMASEIAALDSLPARHPGLMGYHGAFKRGKNWYILSDLGKEDAFDAAGKIPFAEVLNLLSGVKALHARGMVHGDLKYENFLIGMDGRYRINDFGTLETDLKNSTSKVRTRGYGAPEQGILQILDQKRFYVKGARSNTDRGMSLREALLSGQDEGAVRRGFNGLPRRDQEILMNYGIYPSNIELFVKYYDARSRDVYAMGNFLELEYFEVGRKSLPEGTRLNIATLVQKMKNNDPLKRPKMAEVIAELQRIKDSCNCSL